MIIARATMRILLDTNAHNEPYVLHMALPGVNEFMEYLSGFCGASTVAAYSIVARKFLASNDAITTDSLVKYVGDSAARGLAPATVIQHLASLGHLIEFARIRGFDVPPVVVKPKLPRVRVSLASTMSRDEMGLFDDLCCTLPEPQSTILRIMPLSGLRVSEACGLLVSDLIWPSEPDGLFVIAVSPNSARTVKGKSDRQVVVHRKATPIIRHYCFNTYPKLQGFRKGSPWLFPARSGGPVIRRRVSDSFTKIGAAMGRHLNPHSSRHAHASMLSEEGWSVAAIMQQLGHEKPETTMGYISMSLDNRRELMAGVKL
ncbi:MAG: tyrosine-type recombinase/integrase [Gemmatimonadaceae bacterium]